MFETQQITFNFDVIRQMYTHALYKYKGYNNGERKSLWMQ